jgi:hypothetical protein
MSLYISVGEKQFRLTNGLWYNRFLDYVAERSDCPVLMRFIPGQTVAVFPPGEDDPSTVLLGDLAKEIAILQEIDSAPDYVQHVIGVFDSAIRTLLASNSVTSLS